MRARIIPCLFFAALWLPLFTSFVAVLFTPRLASADFHSRPVPKFYFRRYGERLSGFVNNAFGPLIARITDAIDFLIRKGE